METMEMLETGKEKVKKICDMLRKQTLEPALEEGERIVTEAKQRAEEIIQQAEQQAQNILIEAERAAERQRIVCEASMKQAALQALEFLRQDLEGHLLGSHLEKLLHRTLNEPEILTSLITAIITAVKKEGLNGDISAFIPSSVPARTVNELLGEQLIHELKDKTVLLGPMTGGVAMKLDKEKITIDMTDQALKELLGDYLRKDLREFLFGK